MSFFTIYQPEQSTLRQEDLTMISSAPRMNTHITFKNIEMDFNYASFL